MRSVRLVSGLIFCTEREEKGTTGRFMSACASGMSGGGQVAFSQERELDVV